MHILVFLQAMPIASDLWRMRFLVPMLLLGAANAHAQPAINGPMPGHVDMLEARIWLQCHGPCTAALDVWPVGAQDSVIHVPVQRSVAAQAHAMEFVVDQLEPGRTYNYQVVVNGVVLPFDGPLEFRTQSIWRYRSDPPPFRVALGSCTYINEPAYDRPGRPFGNTYGIFDVIADQQPDLMLWLGDNVYLREPDQGSRSGYLHRYTHTRSTPELQRLLRSTKHYAIWDDHDFGPNDADGSWVHSAMAREVFELFWANPTTGVPGAENTIATAFEHNDVHFFLLDNRTHRVTGDMRTATPAMFGEGQLDWLIRALKYSRAPFKLVATGGQVLNSAAVYENFATIPGEREELLRRIDEEGITGVVFLTGDRHFTELSEIILKDGRSIHDLTVSPLTSGTFPPKEENEHRVEGTVVGTQNFALLDFAGKRYERVMTIRVFNAQGDLQWERALPEPVRKP